MDQETINLIIEMKKLNPTWGGQRISDELAKIGYKACADTVRKYLEIYGLHDPSPRQGLSWKEFIDNHKFKVSIDFTSLISLMGHQLCATRRSAYRGWKSPQESAARRILKRVLGT